MFPLQPLRALRRPGAVQAKFNFVFEGDSITANSYGGSSNWPTRMVGLLTGVGLDVTYHNQSVAGSTMTGLGGTSSVNGRASADDAYLDATRDNYIVLLIGYNDWAQGNTDAQIWSDVAAWKAAREAAGWKVVLCTQLGYQAHDFTTLNGLIRANCTRVVDLAANPVVGAQAGYKFPWTYDNTHLSANGLAAVAKLAYIGFRSILNQASVTLLADFNPIQGLSGTTVEIYGSGLTGATSVTFNGVAASSYTVVSDSRITATVPVTTSGPVAVSSPSGSDSSSGWLTYTYANIPVPAVTSVSPTTGVHKGTVISVGGTNLTNAATVRFTGPSGTYADTAALGVTGTGLLCYAPPGIADGPISVLCGTDGTAVSSQTVATYKGTSDTIIQRADLRGYWRSDQGVLNVSNAAPSDGDAIQTWYDLSGRCVDGAQSVSGYRPTFKTGQLNGYPSLRFSPSPVDQTILLTLPTSYDLSGGFTLYLVHDLISPSNYGGPFSWNPSSGVGVKLVSPISGSGYRPQMIPMTSLSESTSKRGPTSYGANAAALWVWDSGPHFYVNAATQTVSNGDNGYNSGTGGFLGSSYHTLSCNLYLVALFAGVHDATARQSVTDYINSVYALY